MHFTGDKKHIFNNEEDIKTVRFAGYQKRQEIRFWFYKTPDRFQIFKNDGK